MAKKKEVRIKSDFVENQKRVEAEIRPDNVNNFYMGYGGRFEYYVGQSSTSRHTWLKDGAKPTDGLGVL